VVCRYICIVKITKVSPAMMLIIILLIGYQKYTLG
jgi:hypothetical protein